MSLIARPFRWRLLLALPALAVAALPAQRLPDRLSDRDFWRLSGALSEGGGEFRSENLLSNELTFQHVIPELRKTTGTGGVYVGVGPEQNFTYVAALEPKMAFIVDIRRQNLVVHLMYKALFELADDRVAFLTRLFARPFAAPTDATPDSLFAALSRSTPDTALERRTLADIVRHLTTTRGFPLGPGDLEALGRVYHTFATMGPDVNYSVSTVGMEQMGRGRMPNYHDLMILDDGQGTRRSYLATERLFHNVKSLQERNLLVPVVGNFAGDSALRALGAWLGEHGAVVTTFYTSNVEQYLFRQNDDWRRFYTNVGRLPTDSTSTFIRSLAGGGAGGATMPGVRLRSALSSMQELLRAFNDGRVQAYFDVIQMSH